MSSVIDKILNASATRPVDVDEGAGDYRSFVETRQRPPMGFTVNRANGDMHGFLYHSLDNLEIQMRGGAEFLTFTHRGKAVTIQGEKLRPIFQAMMRHTLTVITEPDGRPAAPDMPVIQRMEITTVGQPAAPAARLVKQSS